LTKESQLKADNLSQVDLMPAAIKAWYVRNNRNDLLAPLEYSNDELSDVWDMEMLSENTPVPTKVDTPKKMDTSKAPSTPLAPAIKNKKVKDPALNPLLKKEKWNSKKNNVSI